MRKSVGYTPEGKQTKMYMVWNNMKRRCHTPTNKDYKHYGAKGIIVCERWHKFENFLEDMGDCPEGKMLERKDNLKGYSLDNCCWATRKRQLDNRSVTIWCKMPDERIQTASDAFRELGCSKSMFFIKIKNPEGFMGVKRVGV